MAEPVSFKVEDFVEGGGLIGDVDATITSAKFEMFDYGGTVPGGSPSLTLVCTSEVGDFTERYSVGSKDDWLPSDNGKQLLAIGSKRGINASSKFALFIKHLVDAGFPGDKLGSDISVLDGLQVHFVRIPEPERPGVKKSAKQVEREAKYGPPTMIVVSAILTMPGEKKKPAGAPKPAGKTKDAKKTDAPKPVTPAQGVESEDLYTKVVDTILGIIAGEGGSIKQNMVPAKLMGALKGDPDMPSAIRKFAEAGFLTGEDKPWKLEGGVLSLA